MTTEQYRPQVSKREVAIGNVQDYLAGFLAGNKPELEFTPKTIDILRSMAEDVYRIVKRAEGFDV